MTTFYNCSFRNTNLTTTKMYKTSFINCTIDSTTMIDAINVLVKKYEIDYTPICGAISKDSKLIVLGCGNFLILVNAESGKEIKRI